MGSCVSSHNSASTKIDPIMSIHKSPTPPTPIKDNNDNITNIDPPFLSFPSKSRISPFKSVSTHPSFGGSKDETFFDTQGWLDSDCDEDFYSVNGDFTPSRGNTPVHHTAGTPRFNRVFSPQVNRAVFEGKPHLRSASNRSRGSSSVRRSFSSTVTAQSAGASTECVNSTTKSKRLIDLFRESMRERDGSSIGFSLAPPSPLPPKPANRAPSSLRYSISSADNHEPEKEKFTHRCFPRLTYVRSFSDSKKASSPPTSVTDTVS